MREDTGELRENPSTYVEINFNSAYIQYRLKISEPSNAFATRCKLRVNVLVKKSNAFAN